jgi:tRNA/rRNA methyltransferase
MAGTDSTQGALTGGPAIILVRPQLGENIGMAARAMLNCGLTELRLVAPRDGWPNEKALSAASGADAVVENARLYDTTAAAIADLAHVYATTARPRGMYKPVFSPREAVAAMVPGIAGGEATGVLFGAERSGLDNADVTLAQAIIEVPLNPAYRSLNLSQAVLLLGYEWFQARPDLAAPAGPLEAEPPAPQADLQGLYAHLEEELDRAGFFHPPEKRPGMVRNLRNMFARAGLTAQEVRTLRGVVVALTRGRRGAGGRGGED